MAQTPAHILIDIIQQWGVDTVFGRPGDGITEALRKRQDTLRFVQVRHEEAAAFMACGYAKFTGRLGVCLATSGPPAGSISPLSRVPAAPGPALVEATVDPFTPPMPPRISAKQVAKFGESLLKGQPNRDKIALTVIADKVRDHV